MTAKKKTGRPLSLGDRWDIDSEQLSGVVILPQLVLRPVRDFLERVLSGEIDIPGASTSTDEDRLEIMTRAAIAHGYLSNSPEDFERAVDHLSFMLEHDEVDDRGGTLSRTKAGP